MPSTIVHLLRHGEVHNPTGVLYGRLEGFGLSERGRAMAERVWKVMKDTDSRECRNCHEFEHMDPEAQERVSARRHAKAFKQGETCIDCHKGIAHQLPQGYEEEQEANGTS